MSTHTLPTGRELVDPLACMETSNEELESTSSLGGSSRAHRVVNNDNYGNCPKCEKPMPLVKNAQKLDVFFCEACRVSAPCAL